MKLNDVDFETYRKTPTMETYSNSGYGIDFQYYMLKKCYG